MWRLLLGTMGVKSLVQGLNAAATAGFEPRTVWSEVRRRNRLATAPPCIVAAGLYIQQQSSSSSSNRFIEHDVSTRKLGPSSGHDTFKLSKQTNLSFNVAFNGQGVDVVFNKTIAGRRRTQLLNTVFFLCWAASIFCSMRVHLFFLIHFFWHLHAHIHCCTCIRHTRTHTRSNATVGTGVFFLLFLCWVDIVFIDRQGYFVKQPRKIKKFRRAFQCPVRRLHKRSKETEMWCKKSSFSNGFRSKPVRQVADYGWCSKSCPLPSWAPTNHKRTSLAP